MDFFFSFKTCHSNLFGPKHCFRTLSLPLWKWSLSLLTLKSDEPFRLLWRAKCRGTDTTHQRGGDKRQCGFHLTPCSPWEPSHHAVRKPKPWGDPLCVFLLIIPAKVSPACYHQFEDARVIKDAAFIQGRSGVDASMQDKTSTNS